MYMSILHSPILLKMLISWKGLLIESLDSFLYSIVPFANRIDFFICITFIYFSCLNASARIPQTMYFYRNKDSGNSVCLLRSAELPQDFSQFKMLLNMGLSYIIFIMFRYLLSSPISFSTFLWSDSIFSKTFLPSIERNLEVSK